MFLTLNDRSSFRQMSILLTGRSPDVCMTTMRNRRFPGGLLHIDQQKISGYSEVLNP